MKIFAFLFLTIVTLSCLQNKKDNLFLEGRWVDLTYSFDENTIYWPTSAPFKLDTVFEGKAEGGYYYSAFAFCTAEHGGTHLDAPIHFAEGKQSVEQIPIENLLGTAVVIDVSKKALDDPDYLIGIQDFLSWENQFGPIPDGAIVLLKTGYGRFWPDKEKYMGTAITGANAVALLHFPGLAPEAAQWLTENRKIKAIGLDSPSIDYGQSKLFESHRILFEKNIPVFENVANLDQLPATGSFVIALPVKIKGGSGGPLRIIAYLPS